MAAILTVDTGLPNTPPNYHTIQAAINAAGSGDTIIVAAGTYAQDLNIPGAKTNLELVGATGAIIKGVQVGIFPTHVPGIAVRASGVKIHGFTIESPDYPAGKHSSGIIVGAANVEIYENSFVIKDDGIGNGWGVSIETYGGWAGDISGLYIHDNTFTSTTGTDMGSEGIYINYNLNNPTPAGTVAIENNTFGGQIFRAISTERDKTTISGNTIRSSFAPHYAFNAAYLGIHVSRPAVHGNPNHNTVTVKGNSVEGFFYGMYINTSGSTPSNTSVHQNTVNNNTTGIRVSSAANDIAVHHNTVSSNTAEGIRVDGDSNSIHHNTVTNNVDYGIHLSRGSDLNIVHHNTLTGNGTPQIWDEWGNNKVFKNKVS